MLRPFQIATAVDKSMCYRWRKAGTFCDKNIQYLTKSQNLIVDKRETIPEVNYDCIACVLLCSTALDRLL